MVHCILSRKIYSSSRLDSGGMRTEKSSFRFEKCGLRKMKRIVESYEFRCPTNFVLARNLKALEEDLKV